jgi:hypothetical protein
MRELIPNKTPRIEITGYDRDDLETYIGLAKNDTKFFKIPGLSGKYFVQKITTDLVPHDGAYYPGVLVWCVVLLRVIEMVVPTQGEKS